jgi:hypothetical protein
LTSTGRGGFFGDLIIAVGVDSIAIRVHRVARIDQPPRAIRSLSTPITGVITRGVEAREGCRIESWK